MGDGARLAPPGAHLSRPLATLPASNGATRQPRLPRPAAARGARPGDAAAPQVSDPALLASAVGRAGVGAWLLAGMGGVLAPAQVRWARNAEGLVVLRGVGGGGSNLPHSPNLKCPGSTLVSVKPPVMRPGPPGRVQSAFSCSLCS